MESGSSLPAGGFFSFDYLVTRSGRVTIKRVVAVGGVGGGDWRRRGTRTASTASLSPGSGAVSQGVRIQIRGGEEGGLRLGMRILRGEMTNMSGTISPVINVVSVSVRLRPIKPTNVCRSARPLSPPPHSHGINLKYSRAKKGQTVKTEGVQMNKKAAARPVKSGGGEMIRAHQDADHTQLSPTFLRVLY